MVNMEPFVGYVSKVACVSVGNDKVRILIERRIKNSKKCIHCRCWNVSVVWMLLKHLVIQKTLHFYQFYIHFFSNAVNQFNRPVAFKEDGSDINPLLF